MTPFAKTIVATALLTATATTAIADGLKLNLTGKQLQIAPQILPHKTTPRPGVLKRACPDLAVFANKQVFGNRVHITYGVRNVSSVNYVSGANQQAIVVSGAGGALGSGQFTNLAAGQSRSWSVVVALPMEFPNSYRVFYSHDPDLYIDGNTRNDECHRANNSREVLVSHAG